MNADAKILKVHIDITLACDKRVLFNVTKLVVGIEDEVVEVVDEELEVTSFIFELIQSS